MWELQLLYRKFPMFRVQKTGTDCKNLEKMTQNIVK